MIGIGDQFGIGGIPTVMVSGQRTVRSQAVKIGGLFAYFQQPVLEFVGSDATVSFERDGQTIELESVGLESGATLVCKAGNSLRLEGVACGVPVVVCLVEVGKPSRKVRFVFR